LELSENTRNTKFLVGKFGRKMSLGNPMLRREEYIEMGLEEIG
jgi:hypothetical protein